MQAFALAHPEVGLSLEVGNRDRVIEIVLGHHADVAFGGRPPADARIAAHPIHANELVLITSVDDALADGPPVAAGALAERRWLLREPGSGTRLANEQFLASAGVVAETLTLGSNGAIKQAARAGLGVSLVSRDAVAYELESGALAAIPLEAGPPARSWYAVRSTVGPPRAVIEQFMAFLEPGDIDEQL